MRYDEQAATFDARAGIPAEAARAAADAAAELAGVHPGQRWLEVGAGTGALSVHLLSHPLAYTGFDRSAPMLDAFRARLAGTGLAAELVEADGNGRWPAADGSVDVVLSVRALHHLEPEHAAAELRRVLGPEGGWLLLGHVRRPPASPKAAIRRRMREALAARGYRPRGNEERAAALLRALGAAPLPPREAARWSLRHRPVDSIDGWRAGPGLAGVELAPAVKEAVLGEVREWIEAEYGDPHSPLPQEERFELAAAHVGP
jgi:SAM-dependent methyltransferase